MAVNSVGSSYTNSVNNNSYTNYASSKTEEKTDTKTTEEETGVIYEKSSSNSTSKTTNSKVDQNLIAKLKADSNNRISQLQGIVSKMMQQQGSAIGKSDSMWSFLAGGNYTVDAATQSQAQADIADDGYWGVNQTSDRILDFAKALSGGDSSKAEELLSAFKKGFEQATKSWGGSLPSISQKTYDAVVEKFDKWVNDN